MSFIVFTLFALIGCGHVFAQKCLNSSEPEAKLPVFPNQFSTEVEANIFHLNLTVHVTEYYDNINERGRIDTYSETSSNVTFVNYDSMEVFHIMTTNASKSCFAAPLSANSSRFARRLFGAQFVNGTAHILTPSQFLRFGEERNETYIGLEMVRGILCHRWQTCNFTAGSLTNYTIDYYFTQADWEPSMTPVQIVVNGTSPDDADSNSSDIHQVFNVYSYVNFRPGPADDDLFRVPPGLPCLGRAGGKELPPLPEDYYSALYEVAYPTIFTIVYVREYYSNSQQLYRLDFDQSFTNSTAIIEDFNEGVRYNINSRYGSCDIIPINATNSIATEVGDDNMIHLQAIKNHFQRQDEYNYTYEGVSQVRRVDAESWISLRDGEVFNNRTVLTDGYVQVYYTLPTWNITYGNNRTTNMSVPWRFVIEGNFSSLSQEFNTTYLVITEEVMEFRIEEPNFDVFDVSICFSIDQYTILRLVLPLPEGVGFTSLDHSLLRTKVRSTLAVAANISASRLGGIDILERSNNSLLLNLNVLDTPPQSRYYGNAVPRDQIVTVLTDKVNDGKITITLGDISIVPSIRMPPSSCTSSTQATMTTVSTTTPVANSPTTISVTVATVAQASTAAVDVPTATVVPQPTSSMASHLPVSTNTCNGNNNGISEDTGDSDLSSGAAAGLTIGVFVLGVIVGVISTLLTCWVIRSRVGSRSGKYNTSSYSKQRDDVVI